MQRLTFPILLILLGAAIPASHAAAGANQSITVPLSDPSRPALLKASIINGSITVEAYGGHDILVEAAGHGEASESRPPHGAEGMRHIPNNNFGLSADEDNNVVRIEARTGHNGADLHVKVPVRTSLQVSSINGGDVRVTGVDGDLELGHVNGSIEAREVAGSVVAHTTNGDVKVTLRRVDPGKPMAFSSLNGDINVTFPPGLKADVRLRSDRGDIYSDFEILSRGNAVANETQRRGRHHLAVEQELRGTINGGGPELLIKTFNGNIFIHRSKG